MQKLPLSVLLRCGLLLCALAAVRARKPGFKFAYVNATSYHNPKYLAFYNVYIRPQIPGTSFDLEYEVIVNYTRNPNTSLKLIMVPDSDAERTIIHVHFDYCVMAGSKLKTKMEMTVDSLVNYWISTARRNSEFPKCPVMAGHYELKNLMADKKNVPSFVPYGRYRVEVSNYFKEPTEPIKGMTVSFDIKKKL